MTREHILDPLSSWDIPPVDMPTARSVRLGRHVKAALLHICEAEKLAAAEGVDLDGTTEESAQALADLFRSAYDAVGELDVWSAGNAVHNGASRCAFAGAECWCQADQAGPAGR